MVIWSLVMLISWLMNWPSACPIQDNTPPLASWPTDVFFSLAPVIVGQNKKQPGLLKQIWFSKS